MRAVRGRVRFSLVGFGALLLMTATASFPSIASAETANGGSPRLGTHDVCSDVPAPWVRCHAKVSDHGPADPAPAVTTGPTGLSPAAVKTAYGFPTSTTAGVGQTIAIVDAFDDPTAEQDLARFSAAFNLPVCTTINGCFKKVNAFGGTSYPRTDGGWALEISLDVQWVHAIAPGAKILLVEASSNSLTDLLAAEDYAKLHARYVSNSWGTDEFSGENLFDSHFSQTGVSIFVSAGDNGLPAEYPSASPNVISVGGTTLTNLTRQPDGTLGLGANTGEAAWSRGGGGCSAIEQANGAQRTGSVNCNGHRATPDVALVADPASGVSVFDSTPVGTSSGWFVVGGTSASSPMWAARAAISGTVVDAAAVYGTTIPFRDIIVGNNGAPALVGYDLASGRGSWYTASSNTGGGGGSGSGGTVASPLTATVTAASCSTYTCHFTGSSSSASAQLTWTFGNGRSASGSNASSYFTGPGRYNVALTARTTSATATAGATVTCVSVPGVPWPSCTVAINH